MRVLIRDFVDGDTILGGALAGRALLSKLIGQVGIAERPTIFFLDFAGVTVATVSFLRESVVAFRDYVRGRGLNVYPVLANLSEVVSEELDMYLRERSDAMLACSLQKEMKVTQSHLLGALDPKQRLAYDSVVDIGHAEAADLWVLHKKVENVGVTAWSNRLALLGAKGLLVSEISGRSKKYRPVMKVS